MGWADGRRRSRHSPGLSPDRAAATGPDDQPDARFETVLEALATLANEGDPAALDDDAASSLTSWLGLTGLEVRRVLDDDPLWTTGSGPAGTPSQRGNLRIVPLGGPPPEGPIWHTLVGLLVLTLGVCGAQHPPAEGPVGIDGASRQAAELRRSVRRLAPTDLAVLLLGETGSGKEIVARALHRLSGRTGSFVPVNPAAIPADLLEAELFGAVRGAYTGSERGRIGLVRAADGGTLFLDEIGDLEVGLQTALLRVLEAGEVRPVGSATFVPVRTRFVAATHRDLESAVREGSFRADLYYRLAQAVIRVPALRERPGDIPALRAHFEDEAAQRLGIARCRWSASAESALVHHRWPGNVRELRHVVERVMVEAAGGVVTRAMLPAAAPTAGPGPRSWGDATARFRRSFLADALHRNAGNRSATARELGISRQTLHYHLRTLGIGGTAV